MPHRVQVYEIQQIDKVFGDATISVKQRGDDFQRSIASEPAPLRLTSIQSIVDRHFLLAIKQRNTRDLKHTI